MRILFLTQWFDPEPFFKGLPFVKAMRDRGHEVEVLTGFPNYPGGTVYPGYRVQPWQRETMDGIPVHRVALYPSHDASGLKRMLNYVSFGASAAAVGPWLVQRPDVIYAYNLITLGTAAGWLRMRHRCKLVLDVQDLWPESVTNSGMLQNPLLQRVLQTWCRHEYARPDHLTVLSPGFKRALVARGIPEAQIDVIYNWCDEGALGAGAADPGLAQALGFSGRFNVVFAGTMGKMQALDAVLAAAPKLQAAAPEVLLTFVGGGVDVERLQQAATAQGLRNVQFLGRKPMHEMGPIFALADALLVHLKRDPLFEITVPSKVQAYMYAGKPIIIGVEGDAAELVTRAGAGVTCRPEDPESIADAVLTLARSSRPALDAYGARARAFYDQQLSFAAGVAQFEALFASLVTTGKTPAVV